MDFIDWESHHEQSNLKKMGTLESYRYSDELFFILFRNRLCFPLGIIGLKLNSIPLQLGNGTAALIMGLILSSWIERHRDRKSIPVTVTSFPEFSNT